MFLKFRYRLGYEALCREVSDSITWRRFCRIPLDGSVPHPTTLMKLTTRCGSAAVDGLNEALAEAKLLRTNRVRADTTVGRPTWPIRPIRGFWPRRCVGSAPSSSDQRARMANRDDQPLRGLEPDHYRRSGLKDAVSHHLSPPSPLTSTAPQAFPNNLTMPPRLHRPPPGRRQNQKRDHAMPQALHRPRDLPRVTPAQQTSR